MNLFFDFSEDRLGFPMLEREYRHFIILLDESCGNDVEDDLALEPDDNPGTITGTKFSVLHRIGLILGQMWLSATAHS